MSLDIQQLFEKQFDTMRKQDQAKYFLMRVDRVDLAKNDPDSFRAMGVRLDNDQPVMVFSKKGPAGQHMPEVGGILRADKVARLAAKSTQNITAYNAEYFHAYGNDDFCIRAVAQAQRPKKDTRTGIWSADMRFFDVDTAPALIDGSQIAQNIENQLLAMLKPWSAEEASSITHDAAGKPLWDGEKARPGFSPFVAVRSGSKTFYVYGSGGVGKEVNNEKVYSLPSDDHLRAMIQKNAGVQNLITIINNVAQQATPEQLKQLKITLIPGLQVRVGRDSLGGEKQSYLAVPDAFEWKRQDALDNEGNPLKQPGYRMADVHLKMSRKGSMMIVDAAPSAGGRLTQFIPETNAERDLRAAAAQQQEAQKQQAETKPQTQQQASQTQRAAQAPQAAQPAQAPQQRQQPTQPAPATNTYDTPALNSYDDRSDDDMDSFGDFDTYAEDLAAMNDSREPDFGTGSVEDLDAMIQEAQARQEEQKKTRGSRPTM
ncbi:hypothetical protein [Pseudomonas sp.]|uniref:hypothetical protein n=1 Tax=Pseudomonas sp. TaxID=306 RepID=UPI00291452A6|nr:hypothetical protein [Pseudomonas sp.]MDU4254449.1 hypothetical protein [Pseudomonas sp.]